MSASGDSSSISSANSEEFGAVARGGYSRMYVLSYSATSPLDQTHDYESERTGEGDEDKDAKATRGEREDSTAHFQLFYASGRHYFHGPIELPPGIQVSVGDSDASDTFDGVSTICSNGVSMVDLPKLLPLFRAEQDDLVLVDNITSFRSEVRDVFYQMEEVGEFLVEELAKPKIAKRIEQAAEEMQWMVAPANPTFFELQTYPSTNESLQAAGVLVIVMKLVVRGVLLDIIYSRDSYFVTLRENAEELALEDMFVPNVTCVGPCFEVRHYSDEDLKKLILWCALPLSDISSNSEVAAAVRSQQISSKVQPMAPPSAILDANDTQLYCLLSRGPPQQWKRAYPKKKKRRGILENGGDTTLDDAVVFQFNQYVYYGDVQISAVTLDDLGKLTSDGFPCLRAQASGLSFFGEHSDLPHLADGGGDGNGSSDLSVDRMLSVYRDIHDHFREIAQTLLNLVLDSQAWVANFLKEVTTISRETEDATGSSMPWLGEHLSRWLESEDGSEVFFELELADPTAGRALLSRSAEGDGKDHRPGQVDLLVWKGIVHEALLVVIYRNGSFYLVLRPVATEGSVSTMNEDAGYVFGALPPLFGKGRGYLVRRFPSRISRPSQAWLSDAKLVLWQTSASVEREAVEEDETQRRRSRTANTSPCADWFESSADEKDEKAGAEDGAAKNALRGVEPVQDKASDDDAMGSKETLAPPKSSPTKPDRVARPHHLPSFAGTEAAARLRVAAPPPWDLRTGKPL